MSGYRPGGKEDRREATYVRHTAFVHTAWETLDGWIRDEIEVRIRSIVEEVTRFLGQEWYERKGAVDADGLRCPTAHEGL